MDNRHSNYGKLIESIRYINGLFDKTEKYEKEDAESLTFVEKLSIMNKMERLVNETPLHKIELKNGNVLYLKDEGNNGYSVKVRSVMGLLLSGVIFGGIKNNTIITESSSGNTAIAEALFVKKVLHDYNVRFRAVIDSRINANDEHSKGYKILKSADMVDIIEVTQKDPSGVNTRLRKVEEYKREKNCFVPDQYDNQYAVFGTYHFLGEEIDRQFKEMNLKWSDIDYMVNAVSTGAHSVGVGLYAKRKNSNIKLVGVEQQGSAILSPAYEISDMNNIPVPYLVGGAGHRFPTKIVTRSLMWENFWDFTAKVSDQRAFQLCFEIEKKYGIKIGPSTGMNLGAVMELAEKVENKVFLMIGPDHMDDYPTLCNEELVKEAEEKLVERLGGYDYRKMNIPDVSFFDVYTYKKATELNSLHMTEIYENEVNLPIESSQGVA